jgi:hypothetical protein
MARLVHRQVSQERLAEISAAFQQILQDLPVDAPARAFSSLLASDHHINVLRLRNQALSLSKLFEDSEMNPFTPSESPIPFPKKLTSLYLDTRYAIFGYQDFVTLHPGERGYVLPPVTPSGQICVAKSPDGPFLGLIAHEIEPLIFRVFDMRKTFEFTLCCLHQVSLFPRGLAPACELWRGDRVFGVLIQRERLNHTLIDGAFDGIVDSDPEMANVLVGGTIQAISLRYLARQESSYDYSEEAESRRDEIMQTFSFDPADVLDVKEQKRLKQSSKLRSSTKKKKPKETPTTDDQPADRDSPSPEPPQDELASVAEKGPEKPRPPSSPPHRLSPPLPPSPPRFPAPPPPPPGVAVMSPTKLAPFPLPQRAVIGPFAATSTITVPLTGPFPTSEKPIISFGVPSIPVAVQLGEKPRIPFPMPPIPDKPITIVVTVPDDRQVPRPRHQLTMEPPTIVMEERPRGPEEFRIVRDMNAAAMHHRAAAAEQHSNTAAAQGQKGSGE